VTQPAAGYPCLSSGSQAFPEKKTNFWLAWTSSPVAALSAAWLQVVFLLHISKGNMFHPPFLLQTKPPFSTNPHCTPLHYSRSINQTPHDSPARVLPSASSSRYMLSLYSLISPCMLVLMQHGRDQARGPSPFAERGTLLCPGPSCWLWH